MTVLSSWHFLIWVWFPSFFNIWQSLRYFKRTVGAWFLVYSKIFIAISSCSVHPNVMVQHDNTKMNFDKKMSGDNIQPNSWLKFCNSTIFVMISCGIVLKYSGHAMWFGPVLGQHLWQVSRLAWKHKNVNATYLLFILEGIKIA